MEQQARFPKTIFGKSFGKPEKLWIILTMTQLTILKMARIALADLPILVLKTLGGNLLKMAPACLITVVTLYLAAIPNLSSQQ